MPRDIEPPVHGGDDDGDGADAVSETIAGSVRDAPAARLARGGGPMVALGLEMTGKPIYIGKR
jgi:hypothetical protein